MAFVKRVRIVYTKGIDAVDPFMLAGVVKSQLNRNDRYAFEQAYPNVKSYAELVALCEKYVELDPTKAVETEPEFGAYRDVYNDEPVPWRQLIWDTAVYLLTKTTVPSAWEIKVSDHDYRGPGLYLRSLTCGQYVTSPSVELEDARHGSAKMVKIRTYPGLAMNVPIEKASPVKIAAKLLEHGEKTLARLKVQVERETEQHDKKLKAAKLVSLIERTYAVPRYYEGSSELEISTPGMTLRVTPNEYGYAVVTLTMGVHTETESKELAQVIELVKMHKAANDAAKKEAK